MTLRAASVAKSVCRVLAGLSLSVAAITAGPRIAAAEAWPATVRAVYDINFNGFNVGTFEFESQAEQQSYTLLANARLSVLLGAFTWDGAIRSFGLIGPVPQAPKPASFTFDFRSNLRAGSTRLGFADGMVTNIAHLPPEPPKPDIIPLREQHLKGVIDPLSAIMVISRNSSPNPCDRRIPIFDGKERFDLVFSYKREIRVVEQAPSGQPDVAHVCRVKYLPIAGHKIDSDTSFMAANNEIEVALRPIPSANVFIPYQVSIPTMAGGATIVSKRVEIVSPGKPQIALLH
jgi:hypothetical protein